jgi:hypothetical protein
MVAAAKADRLSETTSLFMIFSGRFYLPELMTELLHGVAFQGDLQVKIRSIVGMLDLPVKICSSVFAFAISCRFS